MSDTTRSFLPGGWYAVLSDRVTLLLPPSERARVARLWEVVDETSAQVAAAYHATERRLVRDDAPLPPRGPHAPRVPRGVPRSRGEEDGERSAWKHGKSAPGTGPEALCLISWPLRRQ